MAKATHKATLSLTPKLAISPTPLVALSLILPLLLQVLDLIRTTDLLHTIMAQVLLLNPTDMIRRTITPR